MNDEFIPVIKKGNTITELRKLDKEKFDLIITSPPYNIGKKYESKQSIENYLENQKEVIELLIEKLSSRGSICWQIGNYVQNGEVFPLDMFYYDIFKKFGLKLRNRIIWHFRHGLHATKRFSGRYESILWFTKSDDYIFNLDAVRVPSKYPGKRHYKGPNKGKPSGNPNGKNPSDIWEILVKDWNNEIWDIPNVKSNHPEKTIHPCQFPVELVERCILALTNEMDSHILDPYMGVGSSLIAALHNNRYSFGIDKEAEYVKIAKDRINKYINGELKLRPINKSIHVPDPKSKTVQRPMEWDN